MNRPRSSKSKAAVPIETLIYLAGAFWVGAVHAATPGHGKTIAAAYIVGARGKPRDAVILGIFVTLSHTSGIVLVGLLASLGSSRLMPQTIEAWLALFTGLLVVVLGLWTLWTQRDLLRAAVRGEGIAGGALLPALAPGHAAAGHAHGHDHTHDHGHPHDHSHHGDHTHDHTHAHDHAHEHGHAHGHGQGHDLTHGHTHPHDRSHMPAHSHAAAAATAMPPGMAAHGTSAASGHAQDHAHGSEGEMGWHSHGWGVKHRHTLPEVSNGKMNLWMLIGLGIAGGLLPDPAALAILLSALAQGKVMLGLATVLVFSIGFAATLVVVGVVAAQVGRRVLDWLSGVWAVRVQVGTSLLILLVGVWLTLSAFKTLNTLQ